MLEIADEYGLPVGTFLHGLSSRQLAELVAFRAVSPHWTTKIIDQLAYVAYWIARTNGVHNITIDDFKLNYSTSGERKQTEEEMIQMAQSLATVYTGSNG